MIGPILKGKRIILRPVKVSEAEDFFVWFKDSKVTRFLPNKNICKTVSAEREYIKGVRKSKSEMPWSIYFKEGNIHIGSTSLAKIDKDDKKARWGIVIGDKNFWGMKIADEVIKLILNYAFNDLKLNRVELGVYSNHQGGIKCYRRCGFKQEGIKRQSFCKNKKYYDETIMSILKKEYKK